MLLVGVILAALGALSSWVQFPLTGSVIPLRIDGLRSTPLVNSQGALIGMLIAMIMIGWLRGLRWVLIGCGLALLAISGVFFLDLVAGGNGWLVRFVAESGQREALELFIRDAYWPNLNPEPTVTLASEFEFLLDRIRVAWSAVGLGWMQTAAAGAFILVAVAVSNRRYFILVPLGVFAVALGIVTTGYPLIEAEIAHHRGDTYLASGRPRAALQEYRSAAASDPVLTESRRFLIKASYAYLMLLGDSSDLAAIYLTDTRKTASSKLQLTPTRRQQLSDEHLRLARARSISADGSFLERAIRRQANVLDTQLWITQGLMALNTHSLGEARQAFQQALAITPTALDARFFLGHMEILLGMRQQAVSTLTVALMEVENTAVRADVACTLGDALRDEEQLTAARSEYDKCLSLDNFFNFRAVRSLGGT